MDSIEQLLMSMPKPTLSSERDRRIRNAILSAPLPTPPPVARWSFTMPRFAIAFASILIAGIAMGGYAYAAPTITRGDALYAVKRGIEDVQRLLPRSPLERVRLHTTFALRRAEEIEVLVAERGGSQRFALVPIVYAAEDGVATNGDDPVSATTVDLISETEAAVRVVETITEIAAAQRAVQVLARGQERVQERLVRAAQKAGVANPRRAEALARAMATTQETAVASQAAAAETAVAVARGDQRVQVVIIQKSTALQTPIAPEEFKAELAGERSELPALRSSLADAGVPDADADRFVKQIEVKLDRADAAIRAGEEREVREELDVASALRKNAKHFVKPVEHGASQRGEVKEFLAAVHSTFDTLAGRVEILQDFQPEHPRVRAATALLETGRAKLAEAEASFAVGADERARTQAAVAEELLDRLEDRLRGFEKAKEFGAGALEKDASKSDGNDVRSSDGATERLQPDEIEDDDEESLGPESSRSIDPGSLDEQSVPERIGDPATGTVHPPEFDPRRAEELTREAGGAERRERKERVRSKVEEWGALQQGGSAVDPTTGIRYEFKGDYLRPLSW